MASKNLILALFTILALLTMSASLASGVTINSISLNPSSGKAPLTSKISASIEGTGSYSYEWDMGDGFSASKESFSHEYASAGTYTVKLDVTDLGDNSTDSKTATLTVEAAQRITLSVNANPVSGNAPLTATFVVAITGEDPFTYEWDFNGDGSIESRSENPSYTYSIPGTYEAELKVTDSLGNTKTDSVKIYVTKFDPKINVDSYSPTSFKLNGETTMSIIVANTGNEYLTNIDAKTISDKVIFKKSTTISSLAPNDKDVITLTFVPVSAGKFNIPVKIMGKNFNLAVEIVDENKLYSADELQQKVAGLKQTLDQYERDYLNKKASGYLVGDIYTSITSAKDTLQSIQADLISGKLASVNNALIVLQPKIEDIGNFLKESQKPKKSFGDILKENALFITTIAAGIAALGGIIARLKAKTKAIGEKVHSHIKKTFSKDKEMPQAAHEIKEEHHTAAHKEKPKAKKARKK